MAMLGKKKTYHCILREMRTGHPIKKSTRLGDLFNMFISVNSNCKSRLVNYHLVDLPINP
jgi:hypothetical protein